MMIRFPIRSLALLFCLGLLALAPAALAVDGITLINQATSTNGLPGCAHAGFPIIICRSGSYRLSGDLTIASVNTDAIDITANDVTLDLNGFSILGPVTCQQSITLPVMCSGSGSGVGVNGTGHNVTLSNGNIRGMGSAGVTLLGTGSVVDGVHVDWSGDAGGIGIYVFNGVVSRCTATTNAGTGIAGVSATISFSASEGNGGYGFQGLSGIGNDGRLIIALVVRNSFALSNGQDGIFDAFLAVNNTSTYNIGLGLRYDGNGYGYVGNVMYGNNNFGPQVSTLGTSLGHNLCDSVAC